LIFGGNHIEQKLVSRFMVLVLFYWLQTSVLANGVGYNESGFSSLKLKVQTDIRGGDDSSEFDSDTIRLPWNPLDSIKIALRTKPFITGALDGRNSFVSADPVSIFGLRYGYDWGKVAAHTGIYSSVYVEFKDNDSTLYRFRYISSTFEYKLYRTYRYSFLCFGQVGIGATAVKSKLNPVGSPDLKPMIPLELGMYGSVRLLRYFGLAAGLGTRLALLKGGNRFSGPIYTFGITYFPSAMIEDGVKVMEKLHISVPSVLE